MEARKLNPLLLATDKFQLQKMHPIVSDHLLFSDRKRIITSVRGRRTDMPFRLGRECRSVIGSLRNNCVLCLSFPLTSGCVLSGRTRRWGVHQVRALHTVNMASLRPSAPPFGKRKKNLRHAFEFHLAFSTLLLRYPNTDRCRSFIFSAQKLFVLHRMSDMCAGWA